MTVRVGHVVRLGVKELRSVRSDKVLIVLMLWAFTAAVYIVATTGKMEVNNAAIAIVDEDHSEVSRRIGDAFLKPYFKPAVRISSAEVDRALDGGRFIFIVTIAPRFEAKLLSAEKPEALIAVDATAMSVAGNGAAYVRSIISNEINDYLAEQGRMAALPLDAVIRAKFNPNLDSGWFMGVMQIVNFITLLAMILTGAALIREREHGTIEHLLVMPVTPSEIMISKVWASGLVIVTAAGLSLTIVGEALLGIQITGSKLLFLSGAVVYLFSVTSLGILLATITGSMPQFGLLTIPVFIVMNMLSGSTTPMESMPDWLQTIMQLAPSTHYVSFAQSVLFRGAGLGIVWPELAAMAAIGCVFFCTALFRFRRAIARLG
ncbi:MAG: ABC transporter permease [Pseudomonadota bacterium]